MYIFQASRKIFLSMDVALFQSRLLSWGWLVPILLCLHGSVVQSSAVQFSAVLISTKQCKAVPPDCWKEP